MVTAKEKQEKNRILLAEKAKKREERQKLIEKGKTRKEAIEELKQREPKESPTIDLSKQREEQKQQITGETSFKEAQEQVAGITGAEFGERKREVFAEERPTEKRVLEFASAGAVGLLGGLGLGNVLTTASKIARGTAKVRQAKSVSKISQAFGVSEKKINDAISKRALNKALDKAVKNINPTSFAKKAGGVAGTIAGVDVLTDWYALDNVIGGQKFYMKDVLKELRTGTISQEDAIKAINESREVREIAINKVIISASINPLIWPMRKLILTGMEGDEVAIDLIEQQIEGFVIEEPQTI
ncbi:MAG: hypothetical protein GY861_28770 [bacterium]|nr:hypothetical protein [bacterium]